MFSLLYGFIELLLRKEQFHILVVGLDKAGKTSAVERLKAALTGAPPPDLGRAVPTVGLNVGRCEAFGASLVFWDLGGAPGLRVRRAGALFAVCIVALLRCAPSCVRGPEKRTRGAAPTPPFHTDSQNAPAQQIQTQIRKTAATQFKKNQTRRSGTSTLPTATPSSLSSTPPTPTASPRRGSRSTAWLPRATWAARPCLF